MKGLAGKEAGFSKKGSGFRVRGSGKEGKRQR
jgi:hypothetical protein